MKDSAHARLEIWQGDEKGGSRRPGEEQKQKTKSKVKGRGQECPRHTRLTT